MASRVSVLQHHQVKGRLDFDPHHSSTPHMTSCCRQPHAAWCRRSICCFFILHHYGLLALWHSGIEQHQRSGVLSCDCRALVQEEYEVGTASINATGVMATPKGIKGNALDIPSSDTATIVLLPQTPWLDMHIESDVGWVDYQGAECLWYSSCCSL